MMSEEFAKYKIVIPDEEVFDIKYGSKTSDTFLFGASSNEIEYMVRTFENGLVLLVMSSERTIWSNRQPILEKLPDRTLVKFD